MSMLTNLRVLTKILSIIFLLSAVSGGITILGVRSLKSLSDATDRMEVVAAQSVMAQRLSVNLVAINRAEAQLSADPRPDNKKNIHVVIDRESKEFLERLTWFEKAAMRPHVKAAIAELRSDWAAYEKELAGTFKAADAVKDVKISEDMDRLRQEALSSAEVANRAREKLKSLAAGLDKDVSRVSSDATDEYKSVSLLMMVAACASVIFGLIVGFIIGQFGIASPLRALLQPLNEIASGNFNVLIPGVQRKDEMGQIAAAVKQMALKVSATIGEIRASGREVTNASAEISTSTTDLSQRTEEQAASLEETSAAMEQLSATVRKNAENAQQASRSASTTRDVADRGGQVVAQTVEAMAKIEDSSRKISDIIGVIDEIARQTNLLALNAAVEAARAGEAGRGFAVVASEVRSLAQRSSQAAKDIKDLITNSSTQVKEGVDLVNRAGRSLSEIVESIKQVASIVSDIANASIEQATGIDQINKALSQMDEVTQQNSALVEENAATAKTLEHQARAMDAQVRVFQIGDETQDQVNPFPDDASVASIGGAREEHAGEPVTQHAVPRQNVSKKSRPVPQLIQTGEAGGPARKMQASLATAVNANADWKEF